ncbi:Transmembrane protein [Monoraphidium neglectum]|uniref:GDT1 family protein n=1 Tax=Monoraphidium neglectum TaxID=145388 RepID=A0A0D2LJ31_9CHLO|nr:Transmembrane protein [Monoraphidium neglectum]KIY91999.1 Transmembrane protein [Monoraphidium neglectum]|eukprot:XP_013891019.1 Transmembrane protein [Monoraphidium neglectum]
MGESELEAVEQELADGRGSRDRLSAYKGDEQPAGANGAKRAPTRAGGPGRAAQLLACVISPVFVNAFTLTFLAEWGDRSQIATIGLAASSDVYGVTLGSIIGHALCTAVAVLGGRHLAVHIDERTVGIIGGILFVLFGLHSLWEGPQ